MNSQSPITNYQLRFLSFALFLALIFSSFTIALAQDTTPTDDEVNAIARNLYCPVCESTPLDVCPTDACKEWREQIRTMLAEGKSEQEIYEYFELHYGARVLAEPPRQGFFWLMYLIPPVLILAGVVILFRTMKAWTSKTESEDNEDESSAALQEDDYIKRMEEELKKQK